MLITKFFSPMQGKRAAKSTSPESSALAYGPMMFLIKPNWLHNRYSVAVSEVNSLLSLAHPRNISYILIHSPQIPQLAFKKKYPLKNMKWATNPRLFQNKPV